MLILDCLLLDVFAENKSRIKQKRWSFMFVDTVRFLRLGVHPMSVCRGLVWGERIRYNSGRFNITVFFVFVFQQARVAMSANKKVTGIGGIFFKCKDPQQMKDWYGKHLGLPTDEYGAMFAFREEDNPEKKGYLQWSPFKQETDYFAPSEKDFMINYRVVNMEALVEELKEAGVTVVDDIETFEYGKFVHILDPEGNKIELWEPVDEAFSKEEE